MFFLSTMEGRLLTLVLPMLMATHYGAHSILITVDSGMFVVRIVLIWQDPVTNCSLGSHVVPVDR